MSFDPFFAAFAPLDWAKSVTYYAIDDWAAFPPRRAWWPAYEEAYEALASNARGVLAVSESLLRRLAPTGPSAVVPNGIEPREWLDPGLPPGWLHGLTRPIAVYVGTIDDRIDPSAITATAAIGATVLLVGPMTDRADSGLLTQPNVHQLRAIDRSELASIVAASDVGLIPHRCTDLTAAMSPLKLFEYRAAGLPVASARLEPVVIEAQTDHAIVVAGSDDGAGFAEAVQIALAHGADDEATRRHTIIRTAWSERHRKAIEIILR